MSTQSDILTIVKEDVLRILAEKQEAVSVDFLERSIVASSECVAQVIRELDREQLVETKGGRVVLTAVGSRNASDILRKHLIVEKYFKESIDAETAHRKAHILEHYISEEVIRNIKKLSNLKKMGIQLTSLKLRNTGIITDIIMLNHALFERIVSMGILPGEKIEVTNKIPGRIIVKIKNKKFALDDDLANNIKVVENEKT